MQAILRYNIADKVPLGGEISFIDLAKQCGLYEPDVRRLMRYAITFHRLFKEKRAGFVSHSAASRWVAENPLARDGLLINHEMMYKSFARVAMPAILHSNRQLTNPDR